MNHQEFRASYLEGALRPQDQAHLIACFECRAAIPDLDATRSMLGDPTIWDEPTPELAQRVVDSFSAIPSPRRRRARLWIRLAVPTAGIVIAVAAWLLARPPSPDWTINLPGVDSAAQAAATVEGWNNPAGTRLAVNAQGLAVAPDGYVYEFWMSQGPNHVSAGTFREADAVDLWAGVSRQDFPRLWITLEPLDGNAAPTGRVVLDTG